MSSLLTKLIFNSSTNSTTKFFDQFNDHIFDHPCTRAYNKLIFISTNILHSFLANMGLIEAIFLNTKDTCTGLWVTGFKSSWPVIIQEDRSHKSIFYKTGLKKVKIVYFSRKCKETHDFYGESLENVNCRGKSQAKTP